MNNQFSVAEIIRLINNSKWDMEYFMPNQNEVTDRINARLSGEELAFANQNEEYIYRRCQEKIAGDLLETNNIAKYSGIDPHPAQQLEIGAILVASWGYDQTNVDFYVVVEMTAKMVTLLQIHKTTRQSQNCDMAGTTRATKSIDFRSECIKRRKSEWIKVTDCSRAKLWNGKKQYESWYA